MAQSSKPTARTLDLSAATAPYNDARHDEALRQAQEQAAELAVSNKALSAAINELRLEITKRRKADADLRGAKEVAEKANKAKSVFLAAASHDLRQPLHAMRLLLAALPPVSEPRVQEIQGALREATEIMGSILNALLDVSQLEAGVIEPEIANFSVRGFLEQIHRSALPLAQEKGLNCRLIASSLRVKSDPNLLAQIVLNLVSNAIRHTTRGGVLIGARRRGPMLRFEVWDSGEGIPKNQLQAIFEDFYQIGNPERDRRRGLGLGLAIVDRLARLLDHRVEVRSVPGKGSVFAVEVPIAEANAPATKTADAKAGIDLAALDPRKAHVLLIEDDAIVLQATTRLLAIWGCTVMTAGSSLDALQRVATAGNPPRLVIADYQLAGNENGIDTVVRLRKLLGVPIPAIVITGNITPAVVEAAEAADCIVLHKPIEPLQLQSQIKMLLCKGA